MDKSLTTRRLTMLLDPLPSKLFVSERDTLFVAVPHRGSQTGEVRAYRVE